MRTFPTNNPDDAAPYSSTSAGASTAGGEQGLLGMAFHPNFPQDPRVFLSYSNDGCGPRFAHFGVPHAGQRCDARSGHGADSADRRTSRQRSNHKGGNIAFGPDGLLYIGLGDGGGGGDTHGNHRQRAAAHHDARQDAAHRRRHDPNATLVHDPADQSVLQRATRSVSGRRPRERRTARRSTPGASAIRGAGASIAANGELWVADVGQGTWEEVDQVTIGGNYGWRCREGAHDFNTRTGCSRQRARSTRSSSTIIRTA